VTVGESLTEARYQAGLSVDELSERTRIRDSVIRSIERDDYEACGGDLYVRGYVRAIAGAVGIDAQPLIQEFDQERVHAANGAIGADDADRANGARPYVAASAAPSGPPSGDPDATSMDLPAVPPLSASAAGGGHDPDETRFDLPAVREDPSATRFDLPPVRADHTEDMMAAGYELRPETGSTAAMASSPPDGWATPVARAEAPAASPRAPRGGRRLLIGVAALAVLAIVVVVGVRLTSGTTTAKNAADSTSARAAGTTAKGKAAAAKATAAAAKHTAAAKPATKPAVKPAKTAVAPRPHASKPVTVLPVAAAYAFGPGGVGDGDNPSGAYYTIARNPPLPWSTNWYATAQFGLLKHGTGLLLSLGRQDTITSVLIDLSQYQGVNLQLKVGDGMAPQDFKVAAAADNTGGAVRLTFRHPASARYLLIWFTQLPPNGAGHYQESVYHVLVNGRR
jgi:helix-turn-helix protein